MSETTSEREQRDIRHKRLDELLIDPVRQALRQIPSQGCEEDESAMIDALVEGLDDLGLALVNRDTIANYLLTHVGGDETQPWQAGHNYAMTEAARLVREAWDQNEATS